MSQVLEAELSPQRTGAAAPALLRPQLDGLRFFLFLWVFLVHADLEHLWFGTYALPVFFIISGFLITRNILKGELPSLGRSLGVFYVRRVLRVFPVYYLICGILAACGLLAYPAWQFLYVFNIKFFLLSLEGPAALQQGVFGNWTWNGSHFWSLSVEEQFYVVFPITLLLTPKRLRLAMLFLLLAGTIATRFALRAYFSDRPDVFIGALLPVCGEYILMGCILAYLEQHHREKLRRVPPALAAYGGILASILLFNFAQPPAIARYFAQFVPVPHQTVYGIAFTAVVWGVWSGPGLWVSRLLALPPIAYLGKISYGLYLFHMLGFSLFAKAVQDWPPLHDVFFAFSARQQWWCSVIVPLGITIAMAAASWHLVESPINNLKRFVPYGDRER